MNRNYMKRNAGNRSALNSGFTLVEVMLVVVILGILAGVGVVAMKGKTQRASISATRITIKAYETAVDNFEVDNGVYPNSLNELVTSTGNAQWSGPYMKRLTTDTWGNDIQYNKTSDDYELRSLGPDGVSSGDDLTN